MVPDTLLTMMCILLTGCGNGQVASDTEILVNEADSAKNTYEMAEKNGIDWANEWYESNNLSLPMIGNNWDHFYDDVYEYQWFGEQLHIYEKETGNCLYVLI